MTRVAFVTGAARGIGAATVDVLVADGWAVVAVDRCADDARLPYPLATRAELDAVVGRTGALGIVADATDEAAMAAAVDRAETELGGVDAVIAAAAVITGGVPLWELPAEQQDAVLDVDLRGVAVAARVGIPALLRRPAPREGRFVAVGSAAAHGIPMLAAYSAAKAGVAGLVRALALELRGTGVTANAVAPGSTATALLDESARLYGITASEFARQQPIERLIRPDEIAAAIAWLAGESTGAITGAVLPVDGGLSL